MRVFTNDELVKAKELSFKNMQKVSSDIGFAYKGQWITNPFMDASGRFELSAAQMRHYYGEEKVVNFLEKLLASDIGKSGKKLIRIDSSNVEAFAEEMFRFNCAHEYNSMCFSAGDVAREQVAKHETDMIIEKMAVSGFNVHEIKAFKDHNWKVDDLTVVPVENPMLVIESSLYENYFSNRGINDFYTDDAEQFLRNQAKQEMKYALELLRDAWAKCNETFSNAYLDCNNYILGEEESETAYPFHSSFDELNVIEWCDGAIAKIRKELLDTK